MSRFGLLTTRRRAACGDSLDKILSRALSTSSVSPASSRMSRRLERSRRVPCFARRLIAAEAIESSFASNAALIKARRCPGLSALGDSARSRIALLRIEASESPMARVTIRLCISDAEASRSQYQPGALAPPIFEMIVRKRWEISPLVGRIVLRSRYNPLISCTPKRSVERSVASAYELARKALAATAPGFGGSFPLMAWARASSASAAWVIALPSVSSTWSGSVSGGVVPAGPISGGSDSRMPNARACFTNVGNTAATLLGSSGI